MLWLQPETLSNLLGLRNFEHDNLELIWTKITCRKGTLLYGTLYCHKKSNLAFSDDLNECVEKVLEHANSYLAVLLVGDFNIDIPHVQPSGRFSEGDTRHFNLLSQSLDPLNLTQYVDFITRRYSDEDVDGSIIDHLYCNNPNIIQRVSPHDGTKGNLQSIDDFF